MAEAGCKGCGGGSSFAARKPGRSLRTYETETPVLALPETGELAAVVMLRSSAGADDTRSFEYATDLTGTETVRIVWRGAIAILPASVAGLVISRGFARAAGPDDLPELPPEPVPEPPAAPPAEPPVAPPPPAPPVPAPSAKGKKSK
jgi:hypothetical protein